MNFARCESIELLITLKRKIEMLRMVIVAFTIFITLSGILNAGISLPTLVLLGDLTLFFLQL